jgi:hypothetical protein
MATIDPNYSLGIEEMDARRGRWIQLMDEFRSVGSEQLLEKARTDAAVKPLEPPPSCTRSH